MELFAMDHGLIVNGNGHSSRKEKVLILRVCRVHLQRTFFPPTYHDLEVSKRLSPGDKRTWTAMKVFVELRDETVLYVPFREPSKVNLLQETYPSFVDPLLELAMGWS